MNNNKKISGEGTMYRLLRKVIPVLFILLFVFSNNIVVQAKEQTVKVAFPIQKGLTERTEDGRYIGYTVDYLNEIAKYTGWKIEYVEVDGDLNTQITTLLEWLKDGTIDIMGAMNYIDSFEEIYDYSGYSYGTTYSTLCVREDDYRWIENDYSDWNGIRVGYTDILKQRFELLDTYAEANRFTYETVEYDTEADIYEALKKGEIDAVVSVDIGRQEGTKSIARFSANPYYFAVTKGKTELLTELNQTMADLNVTNPYLLSSLYEKYFTNKDGGIVLTKEQKQYIKKKKKIKVLFGNSSHPLQYATEDGEIKGVMPSFIEYLASITGLQFEFVSTKTLEEARSMIEKDEIDLIAGFSKYSNMLNGMSYRLSLPYLKANMLLLVRNGLTKDEISDKRMGIVFSEYRYFVDSDSIDKSKIRIYDTAKECMQALKRGEIDYTYVNEYCLSYLMKNIGNYQGIQMFPYTNSFETEYSIAILDPEDDILASILNTAIHSMNNETLQTIIYQNANVSTPLTMKELIENFRLQILIVVIVLLTLILLVSIYMYRLRLRGHALLKLENSKFNKLATMSGEIIFEYNYKTEQFHIFMNDDDKELSLDELSGLKECLEERSDITAEQGRIVHSKDKKYAVILEIAEMDGNEQYAIGKITDVSASIEEREKLMKKAQIDGMTGLYNASVTKQFAQDLWEKNTDDVVVIVDIDNFKQINDSYGHSTGDKVITGVAKILSDIFALYGIIGRIGGDEFMLYLNECKDRHILGVKIQLLQEKVREQLEDRYGVTLSIGIANSAGCNSFAEQFDKADRALYHVKGNGRNGVYYQGEID